MILSRLAAMDFLIPTMSVTIPSTLVLSASKSAFAKRAPSSISSTLSSKEAVLVSKAVMEAWTVSIVALMEVLNASKEFWRARMAFLFVVMSVFIVSTFSASAEYLVWRASMLDLFAWIIVFI